MGLFGSAPKIDHTVYNAQVWEANQARYNEVLRQANLAAGRGFLDDVFAGGTSANTTKKVSGGYDPKKIYYTASGDIWKPITHSQVVPKGAPGVKGKGAKAFKTADAATQFAALVKKGGLFSGTTKTKGFDDDFFNKRKDAYLGYYTPQLQDQFGGAKEKLTYALARAGTDKSSLAADKQGELTKQFDTQNAAILSQANDDVAAAKSRVASEKSTLLQQLLATGDASATANEALSRTQQLFNEKPAYNPLGDIFAGASAGIGNFVQAQENRRAYNAYFNNRNSSGNYSVV